MSAHPIRKAGYRELLLLALRRRRRFRIHGSSMLPLLKPDDQVLIRRPGSEVRRGDIVIARHPARAEMLLAKAVEQVHADGRLTLLGVNASASTDSRDFGEVRREQVLGIVTAIL